MVYKGMSWLHEGRVRPSLMPDPSDEHLLRPIWIFCRERCRVGGIALHAFNKAGFLTNELQLCQ
jgi:hypothetical protein